MPDYRAMAREAARRYGIDAPTFEKQIAQESGFDPNAFNATSGASGIAQIVPQYHPTADPWNPHAALDYAARWMAALIDQYGTWRLALAAYNAGPGNVAEYGGVPPFPETHRYLDTILGDGWPEPGARAAPRQYDPETPAERQVQAWTCSVRTATWLLKSIGIAVDAGQMETEMVAAGLVTPALGLLDGSGRALAAWLSERWGVDARPWAHAPDWESVYDVAGEHPIAIGGAAWYHWTPVRGAADDGGLRLANPAPGYRGVGDYLSRAQWDALGPFAAVWLNVPADTGDDMADQWLLDRIAALETDQARLNEELAACKSWSGGITEILTRSADVLDEARRERQWTPVKNVAHELRRNAG